MHGRISIQCSLVVCVVLVSVACVGATPQPVTTMPPRLHVDDQLGAWLPHLAGAVYGPYQKGGTESPLSDWFLYPGAPADDQHIFGNGPQDGTSFVYGRAGPPRVHVVYDATHRIVYYSEGCCSSGTTTLAANILPPPHPVVSRDLTGLRTYRGIALGDSPEQVELIFGKAILRTIQKDPTESVLSYYYRYPESYSCGRERNFLFVNGRLTMIEYRHGC